MTKIEKIQKVNNMIDEIYEFLEDDDINFIAFLDVDDSKIRGCSHSNLEFKIQIAQIFIRAMNTINKEKGN